MEWTGVELGHRSQRNTIGTYRFSTLFLCQRTEISQARPLYRRGVRQYTTQEKNCRSAVGSESVLA
jgi:hypothetical protein